jgi:hypothetical protein
MGETLAAATPQDWMRWEKRTRHDIRKCCQGTIHAANQQVTKPEVRAGSANSNGHSFTFSA